LALRTACGDVGRHRADLRVRHQAARAQDLAQRADDAHRVGRGDDDVEVHLAGLDLGGQVFHADDVGAGGLGFFGLGALREHGDALGLAGAVGHHDGAAHDLVGLLGVDAELHRDVDRFVELGGGAFLDQRQRVVERVQLGAVDLAAVASGAWSALVSGGHDQTALPR
jgi:hypothetical protein